MTSSNKKPNAPDKGIFARALQPLLIIILRGFLLALGILIALALYKSFIRPAMETVPPDFTEELSLSEIRENQEARTVSEFFGIVQNTGPHNWEGVTVEVELFDKDNQLMDECTKYIDGAITAGQKEPFKLNCAYSTSCKTAKPLAYKAFKMKITNAYTRTKK